MRLSTREFWNTTAVVFFAFMLGAVFGNCGGSLARVRADAVDEVTEPVALGRLCTSESGTRSYRFDDCAAIDAVIRFRAEHIYHSSYLDALHRYSRRATVERAGRSRPWIAELWPDARQPESWSTTTRARWRGIRQLAWARTYWHAVDIRRGDVRAECYALREGDDGGPELVAPHTWARSDVRPADDTAYVLDCGNTLNVFWSVPSYERRWPLAPGGDSS